MYIFIRKNFKFYNKIDNPYYKKDLKFSIQNPNLT